MEVKFEVDSKGALSVTFFDQPTGNELPVKTSYPGQFGVGW